MVTSINIKESVGLTVDIERILVSAISAIEKIKNVGLGVGIVILVLILLTTSVILFPITIVLNNAIFPLLARKIRKIRKEASVQIAAFEYGEVKELQSFLTDLIVLTELLLSNGISRWGIFYFFNKSLISIKDDAILIKEICSAQYTYRKEDMRMSDEEFKKYQESLSAFNDIWNYETTEKEYKQIFDHKKKIA